MKKMDKAQTQAFVRSIVNIWEDSYSDPTMDAEICEKMVETFPESSDAMLDALRLQVLNTQLVYNQSQAHLLTYCQKQVAEMNQNKARES